MRYIKHRSTFTRMTDERYSDIVCAICGWGICQDEPVAMDRNNEICHAACVEKEEYGVQHTGYICSK